MRRLISENEALLQPSPVLLKRRSYTRQPHSSLDASTSGGLGGGIGQNFGRSLTNGRGMRSQSLVEAMMMQKSSTPNNSNSNNNNNLPSLAALNFHAQVQSATNEAMNKLYSCKFCKVGVRHVEELIRHEEKCGRRQDEAMTTNGCYKLVCNQVTAVSSPPSVLPPTPEIVTTDDKNYVVVSSIRSTKDCGENNKHPLKKRILAAAELDAKSIANKTHENNTLVVSSSVFTNYQTSTVPADCRNNGGQTFQSSVVSHCSYTTTISPQNQQQSFSSFRPYCGVNVKIGAPTTLEPTRVGRKSSQVTTLTFTSSVRELKPTQFLQETNPKRSNYSFWSQPIVFQNDSKLILTMLDGYANRPKPGWIKYSASNRELNLMRVTHSTYWTLSKKLSSSTSLNTNSSPSTNEQQLISPAAETLSADETSMETVPTKMEISAEHCTTATVSNFSSTVKNETAQDNCCPSISYRKQSRHGCERCGVRLNKLKNLVIKHFPSNNFRYCFNCSRKSSKLPSCFNRRKKKRFSQNDSQVHTSFNFA